MNLAKFFGIKKKKPAKATKKSSSKKKSVDKSVVKQKVVKKKVAKTKPIKKKTVKKKNSKKPTKKVAKRKIAQKKLLKKNFEKNTTKKKKGEFKRKATIQKAQAIKENKKRDFKLKKGTSQKSNGIKLNGQEKINKLRTGIPGLDKLFKEGIPEGAAVLIEGGPGSGKTILSLQLAYNFCMRGKKVLYMTFEEPERRLAHHMKSFGWDIGKLEKKGRLMIRKFSSLDVARSVEALLSEAKKELLIDIQPVLIPSEFKPDIVCIDSLSSIASAFSGEDARFRIYMEQLFRYLESHDITSFLIRETANPTHMGLTYTEKGSAISFLSDGIIVMYSVISYSGKRTRAIEVLKMRGEDIDRRIVEAEIIDKKGVVIYPNKQLKMKHMEGSYKLT